MLQAATQIMLNTTNPECLRKIHQGFINWGKRYSQPRLEAACHYALAHELVIFTQVRSILQSQVDQAPRLADNDNEFSPKVLHHEHVRGGAYYSTMNDKEI